MQLKLSIRETWPPWDRRAADSSLQDLPMKIFIEAISNDSNDYKRIRSVQLVVGTIGRL